jgi:hypothetical protein
LELRAPGPHRGRAWAPRRGGTGRHRGRDRGRAGAGVRAPREGQAGVTPGQDRAPPGARRGRTGAGAPLRGKERGGGGRMRGGGDGEAHLGIQNPAITVTGSHLGHEVGERGGREGEGVVAREKSNERKGEGAAWGDGRQGRAGRARLG